MKKLLIIEDELFSQKSLKMFFEEHSYEVICANNGLNGVMLYNKHKPDLVILDIIMSGMNGLDVLKMILSIDSAAKVIVVSGIGAEDSIIEESLKSGAKAIYPKSIPKTELLEHVVHFIAENVI